MYKGMIFSVLFGYIFGSFQSAYFIGNIFRGIDIREYGSKNSGASNMTTTLGWKYGVFTAVLDILKALIPVLIFKFLYNDYVLIAFLSGVSVIIGHIFPFYLSFRGGKGIASLIGFTLAYDYRIGLIMVATIFFVTVIFNYIAIGSVLLYTMLPILLYAFKYPIEVVLISIILMFLGYYKHISNIKSIIQGKETGLKDLFNKGK